MVTRPLSIWMSDDEKAEVKKKAKKERRSVSNYIRLKVFEGDKK